jgi:hypothetical protein
MKNKSVLRLFLFVPLIFVFSASCVTSKISSNKAPDFNEKISKVYFVIKGSKGAKEFSYSFKTAFLHALSARGISSDYYVMDELALESDKDINEKISKFNPQVVIFMTQTEADSYNTYNLGGSNNISGGVFDIKIMKPESDRPVWRASLEASGSNDIDMAVQKSVKKLIDQLTIDKLI